MTLMCDLDLTVFLHFEPRLYLLGKTFFTQAKLRQFVKWKKIQVVSLNFIYGVISFMGTLVVYLPPFCESAFFLVITFELKRIA